MIVLVAEIKLIQILFYGCLLRWFPLTVILIPPIPRNLLPSTFTLVSTNATAIKM
jgi:hypothetical protein